MSSVILSSASNLRHANGNGQGISQDSTGEEMKKEFLKGVTMLLAIVALAFVTAVASNAQSANSAAKASISRLVVDIPFEFSVDYKTMPAGEYTVQTLATASDALMIQSIDGTTSALRPSEAAERSQKPATARLVFRRYGQRYFLAEVWSGDKTGRQLMKSRDELALELELGNIAKTEAKRSYETVEVMAIQNLAKLH